MKGNPQTPAEDPFSGMRTRASAGRERVGSGPSRAGHSASTVRSGAAVRGRRLPESATGRRSRRLRRNLARRRWRSGSLPNGRSSTSGIDSRRELASQPDAAAVERETP